MLTFIGGWGGLWAAPKWEEVSEKATGMIVKGNNGERIKQRSGGSERWVKR